MSDNNLANLSLSLQDILADNDFGDNEKLILNELGQIDALYKDSKQILDDYLNASGSNQTQRLGSVKPPPRSSMFVASQTANLISLKQLKLSYFKEKSSLKESRLDRAIKILSTITKENSIDNKEIDSASILKYLLTKANVSIPITVEENIHVLSNGTQDVDSILMGKIDEFDSEGVDNTISSETTVILPEKESVDVRKLVYVQDEEKFYIVNEDYEVLEEIDSDTLDIEMTDGGKLILSDTQEEIEILE